MTIAWESPHSAYTTHPVTMLIPARLRCALWPERSVGVSMVGNRVSCNFPRHNFPWIGAPNSSACAPSSNHPCSASATFETKRLQTKVASNTALVEMTVLVELNVAAGTQLLRKGMCLCSLLHDPCCKRFRALRACLRKTDAPIVRVRNIHQ